MTFWITTERLTRVEIQWLVETAGVENIVVDAAEYRDIGTWHGKTCTVCTKVASISVKTTSAEQDTLIRLKFGNKFEDAYDYFPEIGETKI